MDLLGQFNTDMSSNTVPSNDIPTNYSSTNILMLNEVHPTENILLPDNSTNEIGAKSYNSSPWNGAENLVKFKSDKVILHEDNLVIIINF